jgi:hypothetical protein
MLSRAVVVTMIGNFRALAALASATFVLQLARRIVANPGHQADLVVDEDECGVFRRAFVFLVLAMTLTILAIMTWADRHLAAPSPPTEAIYQPQHLILY